MSEQPDLAAFLLARYDEDEDWARSTRQAVEQGILHLVMAGEIGVDTSRAIRRWDAERVLAEVEAKRQMVELHSDYREIAGVRSFWPHQCPNNDSISMYGTRTCPTLRLLALPYVDHPDYRVEWRA